MARPHVAAFTDTYLPTVNGVTYTIEGWRDVYRDRGGQMDIIYPAADGYTPASGEYPVPSIDFPFYEGYRLAAPTIPTAVESAEVVHTHTPFGVALAGLRLARRANLPLIASYHTPTSEYAEYLLPGSVGVDTLERISERYERWFFNQADVVLAPSTVTANHVADLGVETPIEILSNGVDTERFRPVDPTDFLERYGLPTDRPLFGYTGRHGYEKRLSDAIEAAADLDISMVFGGDGPAREDLEAKARSLGVDAHFLGFLKREELPELYSALDVLVFPSPVETQGLVALEANACGTPVVGADEGALADTVIEGTTGYRYPTGNVEALQETLARTLEEYDALRSACLSRREAIGIDKAVDRLETYYDC